jgi:prolyl oligopeptidase
MFIAGKKGTARNERTPLLITAYGGFKVSLTLWTTEYGSAENEADYRYKRAYSPYQNVKQGTEYPAMMFFSGDNDTLVDPLHARKMTALMQEVIGSDRPVLLRYSLNGGHSSGVRSCRRTRMMRISFAFLWNETAAR